MTQKVHPTGIWPNETFLIFDSRNKLLSVPEIVPEKSCFESPRKSVLRELSQKSVQKDRLVPGNLQARVPPSRTIQQDSVPPAPEEDVSKRVLCCSSAAAVTGVCAGPDT